MKILHLITDHQVIERTLGVYEEIFPRCNEVLIFSEGGKSFKHLKKNYEGKIVNYNNLKKVAKDYDYSGITHVIAHYMSMDKIDFIKYIPNNIHVCWEVYGFDLYNQFLAPIGYKIYYTNPIKYEKHHYLRKYCKDLFRLLATIKGYKYCFPLQKKRQFKYITNRINSIQYCCGYDAKYITDFAQKSIPSYEVFNYSLNEVLGELKETAYSSGNDILVGNSASFSNNHLYVLNCLQKIDIPKETKLIMPLSYGGTRHYANDVETIFKERYPEQIETLRSYIPLHEYNRYFLRLKAIVLSAWRQESQGTAIMGFYLGIKVFMSVRSPLYTWFLDCGFVVYAIENITNEELETSLSLEDKKKNRTLVVERYNEDRIKEILKLNFC